ncbi:hypothetical protein LV779_14315 [Streptomyces thinghirensis]|nr:hypothetical protein [Streptomyces thinghirensis]
MARSLTAQVVAGVLDSDVPLVPVGATRDAVTDRLADALGAPAPGTARGDALTGTEGRGLGRLPCRRTPSPRPHRSRPPGRRGRPALPQPGRGGPRRTARPAGRAGAARRDRRPQPRRHHRPGHPDPHSAAPGPAAGHRRFPGALPVRVRVPALLEHPAPLPDHFPDWLNLYDPRDLLGYLGGDLFPGRVTDIAVDSRQPFPAAHSAYWTNPAVYRHIVDRLP